MGELPVSELMALLEEAKDEIDGLIGMMEPYYSQCDGDRNARELVSRIESVLPPPPPKQYIPPPICCDLCEGGRAKRTFKARSDLRMHKAHVHFVFTKDCTHD